MLISIVCVYNNQEILENVLLKSLKTQNKDYELILIDNRQNKFKCAADALNYGGKKSKGDLLLFVHQDVEFYENNLKDIMDYCNDLKNFGVAGVAGVSEVNNGKIRSNCISGIPPVDISPFHIDSIEHSQTLDELLLIVPKNVFSKFKFDNETCKHWHLYGADYCLQLINYGYNVYILPITLYHVSSGDSMSLEYFKTLNTILNKYKNDFNCIYTTCLFSHNPHNKFKLIFLYILEILHLRRFLTRFLSNLTKSLRT